MKSLVLLVAVSLVSALTAQSTLTTTFAATHFVGASGTVYFNLTVNTPLTLTKLDVHLNSPAGTQGRVSLCRTNSAALTGYSGSEQQPGNWQLLGEGWVTAAGPGLPTPLCFVTPIPLAVGARGYAVIYEGVAPLVTAGTGTNQTYTNADLTLYSDRCQGTLSYLDPTVGEPFYLPPIAGAFVFNGTLHYSLGAVQPCAYADRFGAGCGAQFASFVQRFTLPANAATALNGRMITMTPDFLGGYTVTKSAGALVDASAHAVLNGWATTIAGAVPLNNGEVVTPVASFPIFYWDVANGSTLQVATNLVVHNSGMVSTGSNMAFLDQFAGAGGGDDWAPSMTALLSAPFTAWYSWHDFDMSGLGQVKYDDNGAMIVITFEGLPSFGVGTANTSTFQFTFEPTGTVTMRWQTINPVGTGNPVYSGNPYIVGYSPGGASQRPEVKPAVAANGSFNTSGLAPEIGSLVLTCTRPVYPATMSFSVANVPPATVGVLFFSIANPAAGTGGFPLNTVGVGKPGCLLNFDLNNFVDPGAVFLASGPFYNVPTTLGTPDFLGLEFWCQAAHFGDLGDIFGSLITSNALHMKVALN